MPPMTLPDAVLISGRELAIADRHRANAARAEADAARMRVRIANACATPPNRRPVPLEVLRGELATLEALAARHRTLADLAMVRHMAARRYCERAERDQLRPRRV